MYFPEQYLIIIFIIIFFRNGEFITNEKILPKEWFLNIFPTEGWSKMYFIYFFG